MKAVILAGGFATRLQVYYPNVIKSLIEFDNKPFLFYQLMLLKKNGFSDVIICAGHGSEKIESYVYGHNFGMRIYVSEDGDIPLGTGGAIRKVLPLIDGDFLVIYGDSYLDFDYQAVARKFINSKKLSLMTIYHNNGNFDTSNVEFNGKKIVSYNKKNPSPKSEYIDYGANFFERISFYSMPKVFDLSELQEKIVNAKQMESEVIKDKFYEIGSPEGILDFQKMIEEKKDVFSQYAE
mgnify:CR=1 FL=1